MALILSDRNQKVYIKSTNPAIFSCVIHWRSCVQKIKTFHGLVFFKYCFNCLKFTKNEILRKTQKNNNILISIQRTDFKFWTCIYHLLTNKLTNFWSIVMHFSYRSTKTPMFIFLAQIVMIWLLFSPCLPLSTILGDQTCFFTNIIIVGIACYRH